MKPLADELPNGGSRALRTFIGDQLSEDTLDLAGIERELELAIDGSWKFTDPFDEPERISCAAGQNKRRAASVTSSTCQSTTKED